MSSGSFWFALIGGLCITLLPDLIGTVVSRFLFPSRIHQCQVGEHCSIVHAHQQTNNQQTNNCNKQQTARQSNNVAQHGTTVADTNNTSIALTSYTVKGSTTYETI